MMTLSLFRAFQKKNHVRELLYSGDMGRNAAVKRTAASQTTRPVCLDQCMPGWREKIRRPGDPDFSLSQRFRWAEPRLHHYCTVTTRE